MEIIAAIKETKQIRLVQEKYNGYTPNGMM